LSRDGRLALTVCKNKRAQLWDVSTVTLLSRPLQHSALINEGMFNADGTAILFRCADGPNGENGSARLYPVPQALAGGRKFVRAWSRAKTGFELDSNSVVRPISRARWREAQSEFADVQQPN
jgi:hypothetical protein